MEQFKRINSRYFKILAIILFVVWLGCFILRYTSLMQNYYINFVSLLMVNNTINIFVIIIPLIVIYRIDKRRQKEEREKIEGGTES